MIHRKLEKAIDAFGMDIEGTASIMRAVEIDPSQRSIGMLWLNDL